ncbi:TonB-dependent receptor [Uliginosibacterium sp. H3]|uniref:TonB-dependent receptor n=1 Tax=Uliginosibacterium silvisoli TaxID=3114758 RepID=A0ABU6K3J6_9RHOO|nr:TonB-dependent receptor [Uliginosibacterium sp. H3]
MPTLAAATTKDELSDLSLEQLSSIRVTSVSRRPEPLAKAAASIYVITADDIRRSGARSLPEVLRLAPNLQVARLNGREYAISARGFNSTAANKLLVQLDGRSLYTPLFSGVLWDAQDVFLPDVDRIEVISGPGATLWGSNAVNGVINIITRRASETQGGLATASTGTQQHDAAARYGARAGAGSAYRFYAKRDNYEQTERADGVGASDAWQKTQAGFRFDIGEAGNGYTVSGDAYDGSADPVRPERQTLTGANLLLRWSGETSAGSRQTVRFIYDNTHRHAPGVFEEHLNIFDVLGQHDMKISERQNFIFGASYRMAQDSVSNGTALTLLPAEKTLRWGSVFAQDDLMLFDRTRASAGLRAEYNGYTHWEFLPNLRLSHGISDDVVIWSGLSRSVRAPSRIDRDLYTPEKPPYLVAGGPDFESEIANTAEIGLRAQASQSLSYSLTTFYERFRKLRAGRINGNGALEFNNGLSGHTYGLEGWATYRLNRAWRFDAGFVSMRQKYAADPGSIGEQSSLGNDPKYQWQARSTWDASSKLSFTANLRHVAALPQPVVPSYTALDINGAYRILSDTSLTLAVLNAQGGEHREFGTVQTGSEYGPAVYLGLSVGF